MKNLKFYYTFNNLLYITELLLNEYIYFSQKIAYIFFSIKNVNLIVYVEIFCCKILSSN